MYSKKLTVEEFIEKYFEGYILGDLKAMSPLKADASTQFGGVGFPMIQTTLAGIELLGNLLLQNEDVFDRRMGRIYFLNYWNNFLSVHEPKYVGLGELFYNLLRHGIAHTFLTKTNVLISKGFDTSLGIDLQRDIIRVDCIRFYIEFELSYLELVKPIIFSKGDLMTARYSTVQKRLDSLLNNYEKDSRKSFENFKNSFEKNIESTQPRFTNKRISNGDRGIYNTNLSRLEGASGISGTSETNQREQISA